MSYSINIGDQQFDLEDGVDVTELKSEVVRNVHAGGGWVALPTAADNTVEVFVSAGQSIGLSQR